MFFHKNNEELPVNQTLVSMIPKMWQYIDIGEFLLSIFLINTLVANP